MAALKMTLKDLYRRARGIVRLLERRPLILALLSGALAMIAFYVPHVWGLIFLALVPFIHSVRIAPTLAAVLISGAVFGSVLIGGATSATLLATLPPSVGALDHTLERLLVIASWLLFFVPLVPTVIAWALLLKSVRRWSWRSMLVLAGSWIVLEWARMFIFNMATYAPGVDNPPFFSASFLGYVLADSASWLQLAAWGGIYALSAIAITGNLIAYHLLRAGSRHRSRLFQFVALLILVSLVPIAEIRAKFEPASGTEVAIGYMSIGNRHDEMPFSEQTARAMRELLAQRPDLVVLPEGAAFPEGLASSLSKAENEGGVILTTSAAEAPGVYARVAERRAPDGELLSIVRGKTALAPQGEYVTSLFLFIAEMLGMDERLRTDHLTSARWGTGFPIGTEGMRASVVFCSEVLKPFFGTWLRGRDKSSLLVFVLSHNQFRDPYMLRVDTLRFLKVRTVEARIPSVASSHGTAAYVLDRFGRVRAALGTKGESGVGVAYLDALSTEIRGASVPDALE